MTHKLSFRVPLLADKTEIKNETPGFRSFDIQGGVTVIDHIRGL